MSKGPRAIIWLLAMAWLLSACGTSKKAAKQQVEIDTTTKVSASDTARLHQDTVVQVIEPVDSNAALMVNIEKYRPIWTQANTFNTFDGKAQMSYEANGDSKDFSANIKMERDKAIWVHIAAVGGLVNVARAIITPDSIKAIIYVEKQYISIAIKDVVKLLPAKVDFTTLQNLIIGNPLVPVTTPTEIKELANALSFLFVETDKTQSLTYNKSDNNLQLDQLVVKGKDQDQQLMIQLGNFSKDNERFSQSRSIQILDRGKPIVITMDFRDYTLNDVVEMPFSIPKSYTLKNIK